MDTNNMANVPVEESTKEDNGVVTADSPSENNFLEDAKVENDLLESSPEEEADEQVEETPDAPKEEVKSEDDVPFHKHPRFKELTSRLREYDDKFDTRVEERVREVLQNVSQAHEQGADVTKEIPKDFAELFGEDPKVYEKFTSFLSRVLEENTEKTLQKVEQQKEQEQHQIEEANKHIESEIQRLSEEGKQFDKNELIKFMLDWEKDYGAQGITTDGSYDFSKGLSLMEKFTEKEKPDNSQREHLAKVASKQSSNAPSSQGISYEEMQRALINL